MASMNTTQTITLELELNSDNNFELDDNRASSLNDIIGEIITAAIRRPNIEYSVDNGFSEGIINANKPTTIKFNIEYNIVVFGNYEFFETNSYGDPDDPDDPDNDGPEEIWEPISGWIDSIDTDLVLEHLKKLSIADMINFDSVLIYINPYTDGLVTDDDEEDF